MRNVIALLEQESPATLAREALWRAEKRWRRIRFQEQIEQHCDLEFRPIGYYASAESSIPERAGDAIVHFADHICQGNFPFFGYGPTYLGFPPRWNCDFVSEKDWPEVPADVVRVVRNDGSDVKVPWDLSRLQFLPVLAKAWRLTGKEQYKQCAQTLLSDWMDRNPVGIGINWTIAMEAALRAISICLFLELTWPAIQHEPAWLRRTTDCLWKHLLFIEAHNEFSYLGRSNHYLSNIVGLFCLSSCLHGTSEARRDLYANLVQREIEEQVYEDGGSLEASSGYHVLATQMFSLAYELMLAQGISPGEPYTVRLCNLYRFLAALADDRGCVSHIGDCDDGRVELLSDDLLQMSATQPEDRHSLPVRSLLGIGQSLFQEDFSGSNDDAIWHAAANSVATTRRSDFANSVFLSSGIATARTDHAKAILLAQPNGIHGRGSHTHNDKLSLLLWIDGAELLIDSGTGCYTRDPSRRNYFRSTAAHNTIQVDNQEQNRFSAEPAGLFRMQHDAVITGIDGKNSQPRFLAGSHNGYRRLKVKHVRRVHLQSGRQITIEDTLEGDGEHSFQAFFHLPITWEVTPKEQSGLTVGCVLQGPHRAAMRWRSDAQLHFQCHSGPISRAYGSIQDGLTLSIVGKARLPLLLTTEISWNT